MSRGWRLPERCHDSGGCLRDVAILEVERYREAEGALCREADGHEAEGGLRDVTILEVERCREAEGAQRESRGSRCAQRCQEARDGLRDVARLQVG